MKCEHSPVWRGCKPGLTNQKIKSLKAQSCPVVGHEKRWEAPFSSGKVAISRGHYTTHVGRIKQYKSMVIFRISLFFDALFGLVISWPHSGCIRTNPLMCLSNVGCFLWFFGGWKTHTKNDTTFDFRVKQIMYSDQNGRGKKDFFGFKWHVGEYVSEVFVRVGVCTRCFTQF